MENKKTFFSRQLRKVLYEKNITQKELAEKLGVVQQRISFWTTGRFVPTLDSIRKVAEILDVPINYFIEEFSEKNETEIKDKNVNSEIKLLNEKNKFLEEKIKRIETELELIKIKIEKN